MGYYLLIKETKEHQMKYLCKCIDTVDPYQYKGSGKYWRRLLKKYNPVIETQILGHYENNEDLRKAGIYYSEKFDVVKSKNWANLIPEIGDRPVQQLKVRKDIIINLFLPKFSLINGQVLDGF